MSDPFSEACEYCREVGIPEEAVEDAVFAAELCCEGPRGDGCCAENTRALLDSIAEKYQ